jgi:outer membrane protein assembly factor BamA
LLHRCNLALLGLLLCTTLLVGAQSQDDPVPAVKRIEVLSYEGQKVSSVELAGQPELNTNEMTPLLAVRVGDDFSVQAIDASVEALRKTGRFTNVQLNLIPEQEGVRVMFVLQPAVYFGMYHFPGAEKFSYARLLAATNYIQQEPYSTIDIERAQQNLLMFLRRNGYFQAEVRPEVEVDKANGLANVNFRITLNRLADFGDIRISGADAEETAHLKRSLRSIGARLKLSAIREGKNYSLDTVEKATGYLESHLQDENHLGAIVKLEGADYNPETNRADIVFHVVPGPVVHAKVEGARLWPWTRHKLLPVYQQNGLAPELIQEGRQNLLRKFREDGYFDVRVETETKEEAGEVIITYRVDKGEQKKIRGVTFTGNSHFGAEELEQHVNVETARFLSNGSYNESSVEALQAFYQSRGFNEVKVTPQFNTTGTDVVVNFVVDEGPQDLVESVRIAGDSAVPIKVSAPDGLRIAPDQPYAQKSIDDDRNKIMSYYFDHGYLTATFHAKADPLPNDSHKFNVVYEIEEGPQVKTANVVLVGNNHSKPRLIEKQMPTLHTGSTLTERDILETESRLYGTGVFDWAEVNPRRQITNQEQEDVIVKVHEGKRNTLAYGFGYEMVSKGGSVPTGTVAVPGLPQVGLPEDFETNQQRIQGPRVNFQYTRTNVRGKAETVTVSGLYGPLDRRASFAFSDPNFRWTNWTATLTATGQHSKENPIFNVRLAQFGFQLQKPITRDKTQTLSLRYTLTQTGLTGLVIPELVPETDLHTRLSTLAAVWTRDTRDNALDAHKGIYQSVEINSNPAFLGSNVNFARLLMQTAHYKEIGHGIVWANSLRAGFLLPSSRSHVPLSQKFFSGGGSTLRGFPLNGAGPQTTVPACSDPADESTCGKITVPTGGTQLLILNSELRIPVPIKKGLSVVTFYDGGNVFQPIAFASVRQKYTNSVGIGFRYATPVGPVRFDIGHNLSPIPGIRATQYFITLGQAF